MKLTFEKNFLRFLLIFGVLTFINLIRKPPTKDWLLIFLFKGYISSILDKIAVTKDRLVYPVSLFKWFDISFIFDYLLFPVACIYYNQATKVSNKVMIVVKTLYFSIPMTLVEYLLEQHTKLIKFKKGWNIYFSFFTLTLTFLLSRMFIAAVRKSDNSRIPENS
ncbi:CBO0543 family protein [Metabacillus litoralis]|uniref:CBO0543 family protein n=1 Tax=Metabacillus litoralis TaxID=152268 RepID=UPI001CFF00C5|nr:CBO0543 family protein [Metabacillus litoralis]